jgi:hypothetical protein
LPLVVDAHILVEMNAAVAVRWVEFEGTCDASAQSPWMNATLPWRTMRTTSCASTTRSLAASRFARRPAGS